MPFCTLEIAPPRADAIFLGKTLCETDRNISVRSNDGDPLNRLMRNSQA